MLTHPRFIRLCLAITLTTLAVSLAGSQSAQALFAPVLIDGVTVEDGVAFVTGTVDAEVVEINGNPVDVADDGTFLAAIDLSRNTLVLDVLGSAGENVTLAVPVDVLRRLAEAAPNLAGLKVSDTPYEGFARYLGIGLDVYVGPEGVLTGSMRAAQEARERAEALALQAEIDAKQRELERLRATLEERSESRAVAAKRRGAEAPQNEKGKATGRTR